ncbi:MAG: TonB-dependent siderophore receptor [Corticimicrobacter sp.]|uniref:TonB-dependent siderophore receptor n=1 Tax=Corticimicrobacter sp. TaxID=2678536 RepID=UPI0032DB096B
MIQKQQDRVGARPWETACRTMLVIVYAAWAGAATAAGVQPDNGSDSVQDESHGSAVSTLSPVTVRGQTQAGASLFKTGQSLRETPQSVTIINAQRMQEQNLQSLDDVMQQAPGITVRPYVGLTTGYYARGFAVDAFQQDGVPVLMGQTASAPQDMAMYERVEILRGANGLLHGMGNPAATVNLVPKKAPQTFLWNSSLGAGSWDRYRAETDIGGPLDTEGRLRARLVLSHEDRGFFYRVAEQKSTNAYGVAAFDLASDTTLSAGFHRQHIRSVTNMAGVPFYKDGGDIGLPRSTYLDVDWDRFDWDNTRFFADLEHAFDNGWRAKLAFNHLTGDADLKYAGANGAVDPATGMGPRLSGGTYRFENRQTSIDGYISGPFALLGRQHDATIGFNRQRTRTEQLSAPFLSAVNAPVDIFDWDPGSVAEPDVGSYASRGPTRVTQSGVYGVGRFSISDDWTLVAGGRVSQWEQKTSAARAKVDHKFTPYGGLIYDVTPEWSLYASYAQVLQPQTQTTWEGALLDPMKGTQYELGVKGELAEGLLNVSLAAFKLRQKNRAQQDPAHPCAGPVCYYIADGEVESRGVEAEIDGRLSRNLGVSASYTFNTTEYLRDASSQGQPFASFTPKHIVRIWTHYTLPWQQRRWSIGLGMQAQSAYTVESGGVTLRQGGYALVNMRLGWQIDKQVSAALNINNLFDRRYYQGLFSPAWNNRYGEPASVMLTLRAEY